MGIATTVPLQMVTLMIDHMPIEPDPSAHIETLLANERAGRRSWYRRPMHELPRWFAEAGDSLDLRQKRTLFEETVRSVNRGMAIGMTGLAGTMSASVTSLVRHHWNLTAFVLLLAFCACGICAPLIRRRLVDRQLRKHTQL